jgi:hypothetical protein
MAVSSPVLAVLDALQVRVRRLAPDRQAVLVVGCVQRCLPLLVRSTAGNALRVPVVPLAEEGLPLAWAACQGAEVDGAGLMARLRSFGPDRPEDHILDGDSSVLVFVQDLPDLLAPDRTTPDPPMPIHVTEAPFNLIDQHYVWSHPTAGAGTPGLHSGCLYELSVLARQLEWLEREPTSPRLVERVREHSTRAGHDLLAIVDDWYSGSDAP